MINNLNNNENDNNENDALLDSTASSENSTGSENSTMVADQLPHLGNIDEEIKTAVNIDTLFNMSVHFGHDDRKTSPKMRKEYIYCNANGLAIFNLHKTEEKLKVALRKIYDIIASGQSVLMVCTKTGSASQLIKDVAASCGQPYLNKRWMPGFLTNESVVKKSIDKVRVLEVTLANSNLPNRLKRPKAIDLHRRQLKWEGVRSIKNKIGAVFCVHCDKLGILAYECSRVKIPLIAICDSNTTDEVLSRIDYPIPGNDDSIKAIGLYTFSASKVILRAYENSLKEMGYEINEKGEAVKGMFKEEDLANARQRKSE